MASIVVLLLQAILLKNEVLKYFDYEIFGKVKNANYLDTKGLFVGNHQIDLTKEIKHLV